MIDWDRVDDLKAEIGEDDFAEVISLFLEEADEVAATLRGEMAADQIEAALHFLKGSALNLGFSLLAQLCQDGEKAAAAGNGAQVDLVNVAVAYDLSKSAFQDGLSGIRAA